MQEKINGWDYYNRALIPNTPPNTEANVFELNDKRLWKQKPKPLLARWTTDFDCGYETSWWYCIKDDRFNIDSVKSQIRYKIKKGVSNFNVIIINPCDYKEEVLECTIKAFSAYPESYRPTITKDYLSEILSWNEKFIVFGAFERESGTLQGYSLCKENEGYVALSVQKANPAYEKLQINAALVNGICEYYNDRLSKDFYIVDGERNVLHETAFQDYLVRYFGFRKAYCKLHIKYRHGVGMLVKMLYPFRKILAKTNVKLLKKISAVLTMEEYSRETNKKR